MMPNRMPERRTADPGAQAFLPRHEVSRRQRLRLAGRIRLVRGTLLATGIVGTIGFSLLADHQTQATWAAADAAETPDAITARDGQPVSGNFFDGQASGVSVTPTPSFVDRIQAGRTKRSVIDVPASAPTAEPDRPASSIFAPLPPAPRHVTRRTHSHSS